MIKYRLMAWEFNSGAWAAAMRDAVEAVGADMVAEVMECDPSTVSAWCKMKAGYDKFPFPRTSNFLKFCNNFDRDPRDFFILEDV